MDNAEDAQMANTAEKQQSFGIAYAKGILKTLGIAVNEPSNSPGDGSNAKYYVQVGAYLQKENAEIQLQKARDAGFADAFIKQF